MCEYRWWCVDTQEGGTTATAVLIHPAGIFTAWVGDSRAVAGVLCVEENGGKIQWLKWRQTTLLHYCTTALLRTAWVGDSRAVVGVLCVEDNGGTQRS